MIHWVFRKDHELVQDKVLVDNFWESHAELQKESKLVLMKYQGWFYKLASLMILGLVTLRVQVLGRGVL